jgi:hypothetical protein
MKGFENVSQDITRVSLAKGRSVQAEDFEAWTLRYDGQLSDQHDLKVTIEPEDAFMVTPIGKGLYKVSIAHPDKLFTSRGLLKKINLLADLRANRREIIDGSGASRARCLVTASFNASGTGELLAVDEIYAQKD